MRSVDETDLLCAEGRHFLLTHVRMDLHVYVMPRNVHFLATVRQECCRPDYYACGNEQTTLLGLLQKIREFQVACP